MTKFKSPSYIDTGMEGVRTGVEMLNSLSGFARDMVWSESDVYRGPVMLLPGFMSHDLTTYSMRASLKPEGYVPYDSNVGLNLGVHESILRIQQEQLDRIFEEHDGERVALIGHSLGGIQSLYLAYKNPDKVRSVATLGSPVGTAMNKSGVNIFVEGAFVLLNKNDQHVRDELFEHMSSGPPDVPVVSVYSAYDGVVSVEAAQNPWAEHYEGYENIEVDPAKRQSHIGMVCSVDVLEIVKQHLHEHSDVVPTTENELILG